MTHLYLKIIRVGISTCTLLPPFPLRLLLPLPVPARSRIISRRPNLQLPGAAATPLSRPLEPHSTFAMASAQQARRPPARIVPAIPHRLTKPLPSARPITPEESNKGTMPQYEAPPEQESQPVIEEQPDVQTGPVDPPLTPDSRLSVAGKSDIDAAISSHSPSHSHHSSIEHPENTRPGDAGGRQQSADASLAFAQPHAETVPDVTRPQPTVATDAGPPLPLHSSSKADARTPPLPGHGTTNEPAHRHQLSAGALVFRSANESPALPVTPQENESHPHGQQQLLSQPPPGFAPPLVTPFYPGHSHHISEVDTAWFHPPYSAAPTDPIFDISADMEPLSANGPSLYPKPFNGYNVPVSHSQSPSKSGFEDKKIGFEKGSEQRTSAYQNGNGHPVERLEESPFELAAYLSTQVGNPEFTDFILQVRSSDSILLSIPVHGIIVFRSSAIADAIHRSSAPDHGQRDMRRLIEVYSPDLFVTRESLEEAVKLLYGAPLLAPQTFLYGLGPYLYEKDQVSPSSDAKRRMQQVLSYIAAARLLQMPSMEARGVEIARMLLRWDTIEQVLQYALHAGSASRSKTESPESDDPFMATLLNYAIDFMAYTLPVDFKLYTIAPELQDVPRLPTLIETRTPTHNPRLSKIRFGDAPPEDDLQPNHATRVLSTILLSLPPRLVERLFNHRATANQIGWTGALKLMRDVINERESRRQKALRGQLKPFHNGTIPSPLLSNLYLEESVEPSPNYPSGYRLATKLLTSAA